MEECMALNLHNINDLRYEKISIPKRGADEVLVKVCSAGICGSDLDRVYGHGAYRYPIVIGHEFAGRIEESDEESERGKRVCVFPILPCFRCQSCQKGEYATCSDYNYYGSRCNGGFSEYINVKRWNLVYLPDNVSYEEGAMCEPLSVGRHMAVKVMSDGAKTVLISGAGPVGLAIGMWCRLFGAAKVYYFDIDQRKIEFALKLGFSKYSDGDKVDAVAEGTGHSDALQRCIYAVKPGGKVVFVGNPPSDIMILKNTYWRILRKELVLEGGWNSLRNDKENDWTASLSAISDGLLRPEKLITHRFAMRDYEKAFLMMKEKSEFYCKVLFSMEDEIRGNNSKH